MGTSRSKYSIMMKPKGKIARLQTVAHRFGNQVIDDRVQTSGFVKHFELPVRARSVAQNFMHAVNFVSATKFIDNVIHEFEKLRNQLASRHFNLLAKIDQLAIETVPDCAPLVFLDQHASVKPESKVKLDQLVELRCDRLEERGNRDGILRPGRDVAHTILQRGIDRMNPHVP